MPVYNCEELQSKRIILFYTHKNERSVQSVMDGLQKCQSQLNMSTNKIEPIEVPFPSDMKKEQFIVQILSKYDPSEIFVIVMINNDTDYQKFKVILSK